jgi:hypothetical protein
MTRTLNLPEPIAEIFRQVARLERAYTGRKFTPDGHLIGSIGEVIAAEAFEAVEPPEEGADCTQLTLRSTKEKGRLWGDLAIWRSVTSGANKPRWSSS